MMFRALLLSTVLSACVALQMAAPLCRPQISGCKKTPGLLTPHYPRRHEPTQPTPFSGMSVAGRQCPPPCSLASSARRTRRRKRHRRPLSAAAATSTTTRLTLSRG
eukprot:scaffold129155_cov27-Tisochrysis_lutea.AAC.1